MKIQIFGSGCDKCIRLTANVSAAADNLGIKTELEKITDLASIASAGVMMTPALAIDGKVVSCGRVPGQKELERMLHDSQGTRHPAAIR